MESWFIIALKQYGLPLALVIFFIWRDWKREVNMTKCIDELHGEIRDILRDLVVKCTAALVENTNAMNKLVITLDKRPCFMYAVQNGNKEIVIKPIKEQ